MASTLSVPTKAIHGPEAMLNQDSSGKKYRKPACKSYNFLWMKSQFYKESMEPPKSAVGLRPKGT